MRKNVASQYTSAQLVAVADGSNVTAGTTTVYVTGDNGTQSAGSGTVTHKGNGCWSYAPTQAETNYNHIAFTFVNSSAITQTVNVYTISYDPHDTVRLGLTALPNATPAANGGLPTVDASNRIAGMQGTLTTLDGLNTAQNIQHAATQTLVEDVPNNSEFNARTLTAASYATASAQSTAQADLDIITGSDGATIATAAKTGFRLSATGIQDFFTYVTEGTWTFVEQIRLWSSALLSIASGMGTSTGVFRDLDNTKDRIIVTQDISGNRSAFATRDGA